MKTSPPSTKGGWAATKEDPLLETAVVYDGESSKKCGHALRLEPLMAYLESSANKKTTCPVCQAPIEVVCDGMVNSMSSNSTPNKNETEADAKSRVVAFKYRKQLYRLSVMRDPNVNKPFPYSLCLWMWYSLLNLAGEDTTFTAQDRIAQALRMNLHGGMKILHKGKILYPNLKQSSQAISTQLLDVCEQGGKPMVMGTRMTVQEQKIATVKLVYNLFYRMVSMFISRAIGLVRGIVSPVVGGGGGGGGLIVPAIGQHPHQD